jgi:hypothetical protein
MVEALKSWGISMYGPGAKQYVWSWVDRWNVDQVADASRQAWRHGSKSVAYIESILEGEESREQYPGSVRNFEQYRGNRPWHFVPAAEGDEA